VRRPSYLRSIARCARSRVPRARQDAAGAAKVTLQRSSGSASTRRSSSPTSCWSSSRSCGLEFAKGEGPVIHRPVRQRGRRRAARPVDVASAVGFVFETVRLVHRALPAHVPPSGFAARPSPSLLRRRGGASRDYLPPSGSCRERPRVAPPDDDLADATAAYLNGRSPRRRRRAALRLWSARCRPTTIARFVLPNASGDRGAHARTP